MAQIFHRIKNKQKLIGKFEESLDSKIIGSIHSDY